jgi:hypothetical protein
MFVMQLGITLAVVLVCATFGKMALGQLGLNGLSLMGSGLIVGYATLGLSLTLALRYTGRPAVGAVIWILMFVTVLIIRGLDRNRLPPEATAGAGATDNKLSPIPTIATAAVLASWLAAVGAVYFPLAEWGGNFQYQPPEIFDLPKHLFAMQSLYLANSWPPPSPFLQGESFTYNVLFYIVPAQIARSLANENASNACFAIAVICLAPSLPLTLIDIVKSFTASKAI